MSEVIKIKKGLNIQLAGKADNVFGQAELPELFAVKPTDFHGVVPKMAIKVGDKVKAGTVLFYDKYRPEIKFVSPVSGELLAVNRGERRKILEVVVKSDGTDAAEQFEPAKASELSKEQVVEKLQVAGLWPFIRKRPYDIIADASETPKAFYISAFDSAPLAPDFDFVLTGQEEALQEGIDVIKRLCDNVHLGVRNDAASKVINSLKGVTIHSFEGPHPVGNVGVQIHHTMPINKGEVVWVAQPQDIVAIGKLFAEGKYDSNRVVVLAGSEVEKKAYYRTKLGASISTLIKDNVSNNGTLRYISGNVLTGTQIDNDGYIGAYHSQVTVIPEGDYFEFMGWAAPGFGKFSVSRTFFSWMCKNKEYALDANTHGGRRSFIMSGEYEKVLPMDILPEFLFRAILVDDIDKMEQLGIYELAEEDVALCEFVCTSKQPLQATLRRGIDLIIKELS
ncbi:Na(+)-translocating NADH-quinone reductase subunit A [Carboxylicivirga linearis]|uniref:Na(+)-translocating NADH-quinone reductase subunit A n=1 Tax=Carboxylicivirga linearis TaxID=1628157 RepID=A0ABS5JU44_9BACT|nr:Na(+)-translocating NADH-quinone reductase subunit A [Carboxylicivirga linearis]MBS2097886.1 Na(+)-translocating NADH-quinone reductase subunit A [Carboxylicivirga linearis]